MHLYNFTKSRRLTPNSVILLNIKGNQQKTKQNKKKGKQDFVLIDTLHLFSLKTRKFKQANEELISTKNFVTEKNRKPYGTFHQNPKTFS